MSSPPTPGRLSREDLPGSPEWIERVLEVQNPFNAATSEALAKALTFADNIRSQICTVEVVAPRPVWHVQTLLNSWVAFGSTLAPPAVHMSPSGKVTLRGSAKNGTVGLGTPAFAIGAGYRPEYDQYFAVNCNTATQDAAEVVVTSSGSVSVTDAPTTRVQFDGISFYAVPPCAAPDRPTGAGWPIPLKLTIPKVSWPLVVSVVDLDASAGGRTTFAAMAVPEWTLGSSSNLLIQHVPGLTPGRKYRLTFLLLAG